MAYLSALLPWRTPLGRARRIAFHTAVVLAVTAVSALAEQGAGFEDAVKAAFIYKFAPFVTWPSGGAGQEAFRICSYGSDGVTAVLAQLTTGERVDNRPIMLQPIQAADQLGACQILYVAGGPSADAMLDAAKARPVLTIAQGPQRAIVQLVTVEHHVRFDVDIDLAKQSGMVISSKLLGLARAVHTASKEPG